MAYTPTGKVSESGLVSYLTFNQIRDNIYAAYDGFGTDSINMGSGFNPEHSAHTLYTQDSLLTMFHRYKWLAYGSTGRIFDPSGIGEDVSLADPASGTGFYDLDSLNWLAYGMYYCIDGVTWAAEVDYH
jgi:hypothetical protein